MGKIESMIRTRVTSGSTGHEPAPGDAQRQLDRPVLLHPHAQAASLLEDLHVRALPADPDHLAQQPRPVRPHAVPHRVLHDTVFHFGDHQTPIHRDNFAFHGSDPSQCFALRNTRRIPNLPLTTRAPNSCVIFKLPRLRPPAGQPPRRSATTAAAASTAPHKRPTRRHES
jgi:hypothetical protein